MGTAGLSRIHLAARRLPARPQSARPLPGRVPQHDRRVGIWRPMGRGYAVQCPPLHVAGVHVLHELHRRWWPATTGGKPADDGLDMRSRLRFSGVIVSA